MSRIAIEVRGLGKRYRLVGPPEKYRTLRDSFAEIFSSPLARLRARRQEKQGAFWALRDVSFDIAEGDVVGIMHAIIQTERDDSTARCSRMAFAIPAILANRIVTAALDGKPLAFSKMGIQMMAVKDGTKWRMAVKDVMEPAKSAGIQKHDIIIAVDETEINDAAHLKNYLIERTSPGQKVAVKVRRIDTDLTFTVTLGGG